MKTKLITLILNLTALAATATVPFTFSSSTLVSNTPSMLNSNFNWVATEFASQADADTNSIVRSGSRVAWTTNTFQTTNTVLRALPGTFTNPASMTYTVPVGTTSPYWRFYGAADTNWNLGLITSTGVVEIAFKDSDLATLGTPINPLISNIVVYALERPDLFGRTNKMIGQKLFLSRPVDDDEAATRKYVDDVAGANSFLQNGGVYLAGSALNMSADWSMISGTNGTALRFLNSTVLNVRAPSVDLTTITAINMTNTVVWIRIWTNGVSSAPAPQWSPTLANPVWKTIDSYTNTYPTASGTNYTISFQRPDPNMAFIRIAKASAQPTFVDLSAMLMTVPRTITNSTDTTWGNGSGVLTWDTNYVYISVGSNLWKRAALSSW